MREIKFRAWDKNNPFGKEHQMIEFNSIYSIELGGGEIKKIKYWSYKGDTWETDNFIIMWYIGFKDKSEIKKEIYEDDIIYLGEGDEKIKLIIAFKDGAWVATGMHGDYEDHSLYDLVHYGEKIKVIGNKHEEFNER